MNFGQLMIFPLCKERQRHIIKMKPLERNAIVIRITDKEIKQFDTCKLGGLPSLPVDFAWPCNSENENIPLSFIGQFDLEEITKLDIDKELPNKGMLYFFYDFSAEVTGGSPVDKDSVKVIYYDGEYSNLVITSIPKEIDEKFIIPEISIKAEAEYEAPYLEEIKELLPDYDGINVCMEEYDGDCKLLGYSDLIQGSMLAEVAMVVDGVDVNSFSHLNKKANYLSRAKDWVLLFQLDLLETEDYFLEIGDGGRLFIFIKKEDLAKADFSNVWAITQCY